MKNYITIFIFIISTSCFSQRIDFKLFIESPCNIGFQLDSSYFLKDSKGDYYPSEFEKGDTLVVLPKPGIYYLFKNDFDNYDYDFDSIMIDIKDSGKFNYYLKDHAIKLIKSGMDGPILYWKCNKLLNGFQKDTFSNGCIRICGNFINGKPIDTLVYFYQNGHKKKSFIYSKCIVYIEYFDSLSNLISINKNSLKSYFLTDYEWIDYFPDKKIKRKESKKNNIIKIDEYFPNGLIKIKQSKNRRIENHENGLLKVFYKRKKINRFDRLLGFSYQVEKKEYDNAGNLILSAIYEIWTNGNINSEFFIEDSDWIITLRKYEHGKIVSEINDVANKKE